MEVIKTLGIETTLYIAGTVQLSLSNALILCCLFPCIEPFRLGKNYF